MCGCLKGFTHVDACVVNCNIAMVACLVQILLLKAYSPLPKDCKWTKCTYSVPQPRVEASVEEMEDRLVRSAEVEGREFEVQIL